MISLRNVLAFAGAELRQIRRLVRYWVFVVLASLITIVAYLYYAVILHRLFSSWSGSVGAMNPRFIVSGIGLYFILIFSIGLVFIAFDVRARDVRERVHEVLDTRPYGNAELVAGRFLGQLASGWIPMVVLWVALVVLGQAIGEPIQAYSVLGLTTFMAIPAFSFTIGLTYVIALLVRNRLIAGVLAVALIIGQMVALVFSTVRTLPWFDLTGAYSLEFPSDIVTRLSDGEGWLQRAGVMVAAAGLLALAAGLHPRLDRRRAAMRLGGLAGVVVGIALVGAVVTIRTGQVERLARWQAAHEAVEPATIPDVLAVRADVDLTRPRAIDASVSLSIRPVLDEPLREATFTLNPGLAVSRVAGPSGEELSFTTGDGLLRVALEPALAPGAETELTVDYSGGLRTYFGYLDSVINVFTVSLQEGGVFLLGYTNGYLEPDYVALMPGLHWLPTAGAAVSPRSAAIPRRDLFELDLAVTAPEGWRLAGPGRGVQESGKTRFSPGAALPEVALVGGPFASRSIEAGGVLCEVLLHPGHDDVFEVLAEAEEELKSAVEERLADARETGLPYPYDAFTLVEVPTSLRAYGGGWRMDTTLAPPAMLLLKEAGLPTARFDVPFKNRKRYEDREGGIGRAMRERLESFFEYDFSGGNLFTGAAKNFLTYQTAPRGPDALALDTIVEMAATKIVTDRRGYFSVHLFDADLGPTINELVLQATTSDDASFNFAEALIDATTSRTEVWDAVLGTSLGELDPWDAPEKTLDALVLKGSASAEALLEELGRTRLAEVLATLRAEHGGGSYTRDDLVEAAGERREAMDEQLALWIDETSLPGFVVEEAEAYRLKDDDDGTPRYQLVVTLRNDEPAPGLVRVRYKTRDGNVRRDDATEPFKLAGRSSARVGVVTGAPPTDVRVAPFLSLNREEFVVDLPAIDEERPSGAEPFRGVDPLVWEPPDEGIVVDDLDNAFAVADAERRSMFRFRIGAADEETDQGLPVMRLGARPQRWSRLSVPEAHGRYRHTAALVMTDSSESSASWSSEVPQSSRYALEIYLPPKSALGLLRFSERGSWTIEIEDRSGTTTTTFDADAANEGWNAVGSFELAEGPVAVRVAMDGGGEYVVADAIRWVPAAREEAGTR